MKGGMRRAGKGEEYKNVDEEEVEQQQATPE